MGERITTCTACNGLGYRRCACWPGDCICGLDDQDCFECGGEGIIDHFYDDFDNYGEPEEGRTSPTHQDGEGA